jgi:hypothetical protein
MLRWRYMRRTSFPRRGRRAGDICAGHHFRGAVYHLQVLGTETATVFEERGQVASTEVTSTGGMLLNY